MADLATELVSKCFVSYRRDDNDTFGGVVDRLVSDIRGHYAAATGQQLDFFVDRDSIGWGEDWRNSIADSVLSATLFIPVVTMRYFQSSNCLDELRTFHRHAETQGVTSLILPIVLSGAHQIHSDSDQADIRLIERLNLRDLSEAWESGYESAEWRRAIRSLVDGLQDALDRAETQIASQPLTEDQSSIGDAAGDPNTEELADLSRLTTDSEHLEASGKAMLGALDTFATAAKSTLGDDLDNLTPSQMNFRLLALARDLAPASAAVRETGDDFRSRTDSIDVQLRAFIREAADVPQTRAEVEEMANTISSDLGDLQVALDGLDELVSMLKTLSMMNVRLRKSLQPAMRGLASIQASLNTVQGWKHLTA
jgi:hypothetical protein